MKSVLAETALCYAQKGYSVIPVRPDKKPYIKWQEYQNRVASPEEIKKWWSDWPKAMIGIVTGSISGIVVIDIDTTEGREAINEYVPDSLSMPTVQTPRGGQHLYFKAPSEVIRGNAGAIPGCDFRAEGNYIIAPPSRNGNGKGYSWVDGLSLDEVMLPDLPLSYSMYLNNIYRSNLLEKTEGEMFALGARDNDLFHVAHCLAKGTMPASEIEQVINILAKSCTPPFPEKEVKAKVESAVRRAHMRERTLSQEVKEWVLSTNGYFLSTDIYNCLQLSTREERKNVSTILKRLVDEGVTERHSTKNGCFRLIDRECEEIDWIHASTDFIDIKWPFALESYVGILPKNIVIVAGEPNAGKTAFLLNFIAMNMQRHKMIYFSSEMGGPELRARMSKFDMPLGAWKFDAKERSSNFADVIEPNAINVIDFLEVHDEFYKMGGYIKEIYDKLNTGIAVIAIQKNKGVEFGLGGTRGLEKARLYLAMEPNRIRIIKGKNWVDQTINPNGLELEFKLAQGCKFIKTSNWTK